ncbi:MAG: Do family serine endopeptidase, partial [Rhizobiales bacterium]|nr:Do family serine endopeptidase [Hyphomicrobiales bacterium]
MSTLYSKASPRMLSLLAAGLLAATALTGIAVSLPVTPVHASTHAAIDPSRGFADLVDQVMPAVISVQVKFANVAATGTDGSAQPMPDLPPDSPFRDFFKQFPQFRNGQPFEAPQPHGTALGSGFIISADGYAVTNNHVVQNAEEVTVKTKDGTEYQAKVIGTDPKTDLALLKIKSDKTFSFVKFSNKEPRVGDWVVAVGNPFGLGGTVTTGIISARGRDIGAGPYDDFLQIDASINKGNSGGPSFNLEGDVIGVNSAIYSPSGGSVGIGFAIPASTAETVIESLKSSGRVTRGWLGVQIQPVTSDIAGSLGLASNQGAIVADVTEGSPALVAGLKTGDTILKIDGKNVADARDLARKVAEIKPGASVPVTIVRGGKTMDVTVKIGTMPAETKVASAGGQETPSADNSLAGLGIRIAPAQDGAGVTVTGVDPNGPASDSGLKEGDIILEVAGKEVHAPSDVRDAL